MARGRKRAEEYTDLELAEVIRSIVKGLTQDELRAYFPAVTPNDLSRVGRKTRRLSVKKRRAWEEVVTAWEESGRPPPLRLAETMQRRLPDRARAVFGVLVHRAWRATGLPLEERLEVGREILRAGEYTPRERSAFRELARAALEGRADAQG